MGLFDGTSLERPVTCPACQKQMVDCGCPRDAEGHPCRPQDQKILVRVEKRPGGRKATVARGFDPVASDLPGILRQLKPKCGGGGTTRDDTIEVQGEHVDSVVALLNDLGYPAREG